MILFPLSSELTIGDGEVNESRPQASRARGRDHREASTGALRHAPHRQSRVAVSSQIEFITKWTAYIIYSILRYKCFKKCFVGFIFLHSDGKV